jgi:demethylmenaquinone methyltransferase/2-methoxy-6-polyprenyl-1,4-benzoquinol methylase
VSTYVYMRLLESAPRRYDLGIRLFSLGRVTAMYEAVAEAAVGGDRDRAPRILELGCGTGNLTRALLARGATVTAIDANPDMLAVAAEKLGNADGRLDLREMAAVEIADRFPSGRFDAVAGTLVFSEMSEAEQDYVLAAARRVLRPGGRLAVADELRPPGRLARWWRAALRWPLAVLTYVLTQTTTAAVRDLAGRVQAAGFGRVEERRLPGGAGLVVAERPAEPA